MTVNGPLQTADAGFTLSHEHVMVDFIGAAKVNPNRYNTEEVYNKVLPYLQEVAKSGCKTIIECTPAYIGRDVLLLKRLSIATGLNIVTNTGYYGAASEKFIPEHVYKKSAKEIADIWINEWEKGIDSTDIKPGLIKTGVDTAPLSAIQCTLIEAACITHKATGLPFAVHTGNGAAALEEFEIIKRLKIKPEAWIWVHAQSEKDSSIHIQLAKAGVWISFDGLNDDNFPEYLEFLQLMNSNNLLHRVLISHDAGWYNVGEDKGGNFRNYSTVFTKLLPAMRNAGFLEKDIEQVFVKNAAYAFRILI